MLDGAESSPWWWTLWRHVPLEASQRNRDHPPAVHGTPRWDTDKVVALMLRSHTVVLAAPSRGAWFDCVEEGVPCAGGAGVEGWAVRQLP